MRRMTAGLSSPQVGWAAGCDRQFELTPARLASLATEIGKLLNRGNFVIT